MELEAPGWERRAQGTRRRITLRHDHVMEEAAPLPHQLFTLILYLSCFRGLLTFILFLFSKTLLFPLTCFSSRLITFSPGNMETNEKRAERSREARVRKYSPGGRSRAVDGGNIVLIHSGWAPGSSSHFHVIIINDRAYYGGRLRTKFI